MDDLEINSASCDDALEKSAHSDSIEFMFHPTFLTSDRNRMARWMERVFRKRGLFQAELMKGMGASDEYPSDYSYYMWLSDCQMDVIQPDLYKLPGVEQAVVPLDRLSEIGWHLRDANAVYTRARRHGLRVVDQLGRELTADTVPNGTSPIVPELILIWLDPRDAGLGMELAQMTPEIREHNAKEAYPPFRADWTHPEVQSDDPLGLARCSHHTILTKNLERSLRCAVDVLGGEIIHHGSDAWLKTSSTFVLIAGSVLEYAEVSDPESSLHREWQPAPANLGGQTQEDVYHAITFHVADLEKAASHLIAEGIGFEYRSSTMVVTDPKDCLGMRWGFTSALLPSDPRQGDK